MDGKEGEPIGRGRKLRGGITPIAMPAAGVDAQHDRRSTPLHRLEGSGEAYAVFSTNAWVTFVGGDEGSWIVLSRLEIMQR